MGAKYDQLDLDERIEMSRLYEAGTSRREIGRIIGRSASTVGRELRRNTLPSGGYKPASADRIALSRCRRLSRIERVSRLRSYVCDRLAMGWSPEQIAGRLEQEGSEHSISYESIYRFIYRPRLRREKLNRFLPRAKAARGRRYGAGSNREQRLSVHRHNHAGGCRHRYFRRLLKQTEDRRMQYRDFILVLRAVERSEGSQPQKIMVQVFDSPVGQGEEEELIDIPGSLSASISDLDGRIFEKDENLLLEFGEMIGNILLPKYARNLFSMSYVRLREKEGLRLRLRLDDELADIPWECALVRDARGELTSSGFLALNPKVSIVRYEALPVPGDWFEAPGTRRVLVVMASPKNGVRELPGLLDEQRKLKAALSVVSGIEVDYRPDLSPQASSGPSATLEDLSLGLTKKTDVFHFAGHGEFDRRRLGAAPESSIGSGAIILCDQEKKPVFLPADRLAEMLRGKGVRLAVLGACEGARRDGHNVWSSVAAALLKAEIPAVVAMQFSIVDDLSAEFSAAFYRALVAGQTVDEAVSQGRAGIRLKALQEGCKNARDWCTPVLYLRSPGGGVFNPVSDEKVVAEAQSALDEVSQSIVDVAKAGEVIGTVIGGPKSTPTKVQQKVSEDLAGLMIGGTIFGEAGGKLTVIQDVNTVTGRMFGAVFDAKAGRSCSALTSLYEKLGVSARRDAKTEASGRICPNPECRRPVKPAWKFCGTCGTPLQCPKCQAHFDEVVASCPECGAKVQAN